MRIASPSTLAWLASAGAALALLTAVANAAPAPASPPAGKTAPPPTVAAPDKVWVYYAHGTQRCPTCLKIQATVEQTIRERFAAQTASGVLAFGHSHRK